MSFISLASPKDFKGGLHALGFRAEGVVPGSFAAAFQTSLGALAGGYCFSLLQKIGSQALLSASAVATSAFVYISERIVVFAVDQRAQQESSEI